jgi:hypothetical protein
MCPSPGHHQQIAASLRFGVDLKPLKVRAVPNNYWLSVGGDCQFLQVIH